MRELKRKKKKGKLHIKAERDDSPVYMILVNDKKEEHNKKKLNEKLDRHIP